MKLQLNNQEYHQLGSNALGADEKTKEQQGTLYGAGSSAEIAKQFGRHPDFVIKAKAFAREFTPEEAKQLDDLGLSRSHGLALIKVRGKQQRMQVARKAAKNKWSVFQLSAHIRGKVEIRPYGGRKLADQKSFDDVKEHIRTMAQKLSSYLELATDDHSDKFKQPTLKHLKRLRNQVKRLRNSWDD